MSGTSLDGLDLAFCKFTDDDKYEIVSFQSVPYPEDIALLHKTVHESEGEDLKNTETYYSDFVAQELVRFINGLEQEPQFIACHGHTVFHQPERKMTFQMLNGHIVLEHTGITTIFDFRSLDIALGGNGAPLVPIGDKNLFSEWDGCLNIGGIANISTDYNGQRRAFDICPANIVLNKLANEQDLPFDKDGNLARNGIINEQLLNNLNDLDFYKLFEAKSLGLEWIEDHFLPRLHGYNFQERITTCTEHMAIQIANSIEKLGARRILCTGGGVFNNYLIERIKAHTDTLIHRPDRNLIEAKEALIFAYLGKLRLENKVNVLASFTGAKNDSCSGIVLNSSQLCVKHWLRIQNCLPKNMDDLIYLPLSKSTLCAIS